MKVVKRDGRIEEVSFDKINRRIAEHATGLEVDVHLVSQEVIQGLRDGIETEALDRLAAETAGYKSQDHYDYSRLAARLAVSNLQKMTSPKFSDCARELHTFCDRQGKKAALLSDELMQFVSDNQEVLDAAIDNTRDFDYDFFGFRTLERAYLLKIAGRIVERPQYMIMRVACGVLCGDLEGVLETYELMSRRFFTHATPTLFNAGLPRAQMSSCFLLPIDNDSIDGIFSTLTKCAKISKFAGGIGVSISNVRAKGSYIRGTNGESNGLVPMLRVFNDTCRYVDQGGGKRKGAFAMYIEPWHLDIEEFLDLKKNHGKEEQRARDLFYGLWIPDLFMRRVEQALSEQRPVQWTLFCPAETTCPETGKSLYDTYGDEFEALYTRFEQDDSVRKRQMNVLDVWKKILESQQETGTPYMLYKDAVNNKSNQKNLGTIRSSNLCTEICEFTSADEVAVCNLASLALPSFVKGSQEYKPSREDSDESLAELAAAQQRLREMPVDESARCFRAVYDFEMLHRVTKRVARNLDSIIDRNHYPVVEAQVSNERHRPIGIGVQGLADTFAQLKIPYESAAARKLNREIFETIYHAACEASCEMAVERGAYSTFAGSPASQGELQFDLWGQSPDDMPVGGDKVGRDGARLTKQSLCPLDQWVTYDWAGLKAQIVEKGLRNSLLVAPMPTASTAQILGNTESFEPVTMNLYVRRVLAGEFIQINRHLLRDLKSRGLWCEALKNEIMARNGSVQGVDEIPDDLRRLYKTVFEIRQRAIVQLAADRGPFIDQSQSLNIHLEGPTPAKLSAMHLFGWKCGLKTGQYYLRTKAATDAIKFTVAAKAPVAQSATADKENGAAAADDNTPVAGEQKEPAAAAPRNSLAEVKAQLEANSKYECINCSA